MSGFEWFLIVVVVILIPLAIAVVVTLWTLEQARKRNPRNRSEGKKSGTKRVATHAPESRRDDSERQHEGDPPLPPQADDATG